VLVSSVYSINVWSRLKFSLHYAEDIISDIPDFEGEGIKE